MNSSRLVLILLTLFTAFANLRAEWITLQVPLGRSGHAFELWEVDETTPTGAGGDLVFPDKNIIPFTETPADVVEFVGGSFNSSGTWVPDSQSYLAIQVKRQRPGTHFWLKDLTSGDFGVRDQTGLRDAYWRDPQVLTQTPFWFFAIPEAKADHILGLYSSSSGAFTMLSKSAIQGEYSQDGTSFTSYGFFEAWSLAYPSPINGGQFTTQGFQLVDITDGTMVADPGFNLVNPSEWVPFTGSFPAHTVTFLVPDSATYYLYIEDGAPQALYPSFGDCSSESATYYSVYYVTVAVGQYCRYSLERSDLVRASGFMMGESNQFHDLSSYFPVPQPHNQSWNWMSFQFLGSYHPNDVTIRYADGSSSSLSYYNDYSLTYWDEYGNQGTIPSYEGYASVDTGQEWWVEVNGVNKGTGTYFSDAQWPAIWNGSGPNGSINLTFPVVRQSSRLWLGDGGTWSFTNSYTTIGHVGGYFGPNGEWTSWEVFTANSLTGGGGSQSIYDEVFGDTLYGSNYGFSKDTAFWFPTHPLLLKISGTRWGNDLRIRTGSGGEYPIVRNKMQGTWYLDSAGKPWFVSYGYFDATATAEHGVQWWLVDYSRMGANGPEILVSGGSDPANFIGSTDTLDSDEDGWPDWYERFVGTNPHLADTDGDGIDDPADPNPRARSADNPSSTLKVWTSLRQ